MSDFSGYSTASKYALAQKDAELDSMKSKMEEMAKTINEMQKSTATTNATRGRGRGRGQGNSARGSTGGAKGHGVSKPNNEDFLVTTEFNLSKKRINNSPKMSSCEKVTTSKPNLVSNQIIDINLEHLIFVVEIINIFSRIV